MDGRCQIVICDISREKRENHPAFPILTGLLNKHNVPFLYREDLEQEKIQYDQYLKAHETYVRKKQHQLKMHQQHLLAEAEENQAGIKIVSPTPSPKSPSPEPEEVKGEESEEDLDLEIIEPRAPLLSFTKVASARQVVYVNESLTQHEPLRQKGYQCFLMTDIHEILKSLVDPENIEDLVLQERKVIFKSFLKAWFQFNIEEKESIFIYFKTLIEEKGFIDFLIFIKNSNEVDADVFSVFISDLVSLSQQLSNDPQEVIIPAHRPYEDNPLAEEVPEAVIKINRYFHLIKFDTGQLIQFGLLMQELILKEEDETPVVMFNLYRQYKKNKFLSVVSRWHLLSKVQQCNFLKVIGPSFIERDLDVILLNGLINDEFSPQNLIRFINQLLDLKVLPFHVNFNQLLSYCLFRIKETATDKEIGQLERAFVRGDGYTLQFKSSLLQVLLSKPDEEFSEQRVELIFLEICRELNRQNEIRLANHLMDRFYKKTLTSSDKQILYSFENKNWRNQLSFKQKFLINILPELKLTLRMCMRPIGAILLAVLVIHFLPLAVPLLAKIGIPIVAGMVGLALPENNTLSSNNVKSQEKPKPIPKNVSSYEEEKKPEPKKRLTKVNLNTVEPKIEKEESSLASILNLLEFCISHSPKKSTVLGLLRTNKVKREPPPPPHLSLAEQSQNAFRL